MKRRGTTLLEHLWLGLQNVLMVKNLLLILAGTVSGMVMGALPGLTATMAVALLVPFTYTMNAASGLTLLGAIYMGCV